MITNERQYKITKAQVKRMESTFDDLKKQAGTINSVSTILVKAQEDAIMSQLEDLRAELSEYELLQSGNSKVLQIESFEEFPKALIKARIAKGLSQKDLANKLGLKEQQIQRYESTEYNSASFERILEVVKALNIKIKKDVILPGANLAFNSLTKRLKEVGISSDFLSSRIIPRGTVISQDEDEEHKTYQVASIIKRIFGWSLSDLLGNESLQLDLAIGGSTRFKMPAGANALKVNAYTFYAHYLALLVLETTKKLPRKDVPQDYSQVRKDIITKYGKVDFENTLRYIWDLGIPVLPLKDSGAFHGACWRVDGRNIIVLKQRTALSTRWLFDLLHELYHSGQHPEKRELDIIEFEETSAERRNSDEEIEASCFAGDVILEGRAEELVKTAVKIASGRTEYLKKVVPKLAQQENVSLGGLANYLAFRLSLQNINWWGTANNIQQDKVDPWAVTRDLLLEHVNFSALNEVDRRILIQALEEV